MLSSIQVESSATTTSMNQQIIRVALIATGFSQKVHNSGFQAHPHTQVVAVYD